MSRSPVVVGAIGLAGCVALSFMMRSALQVQRERERDPLAPELESRFGRRLAGPVQVSERVVGGRLRLVIGLRVLAGLRKERFVTPAGTTAWNRRLDTTNLPDEIEVVVTEDGPERTLARLVAPPWPTRAGSSRPWFEAGKQAPKPGRPSTGAAPPGGVTPAASSTSAPQPPSPGK